MSYVQEQDNPKSLNTTYRVVGPDGSIVNTDLCIR